jgi:hypothetical protein
MGIISAKAPFVLIVALVFASVVESSSARSYKLWGGQVSFDLPTGAKTKLTPADANFGDEFLISPAGSRKNVFGMVARDRLRAKDRSLPFDKYAENFKREIIRSQGTTLVKFSADPKRQRVLAEVAGRLPDWAFVPLQRGKNAKVLGYFTGYRSGRYAYRAFAMTTDKNWRDRRVAPYRRLVDSLRVRK